MAKKITLPFIFLALSYLGASQNIIVKPYLQDANPQSIKIMWEVDASGVGEIHYGISPFDMDSVAESVSMVGSGATRIHTAHLTLLDQGIKYYYKVVMKDGITSALYGFFTPHAFSAEKTTHLMAISDMQRDGSHPNKFREIIDEGIIPIIASEIGPSINDLEALLIPGDLVPTGGSYNQWKDFFFAPADSLFPRVPIYPVPGNHEYFGGGLPNFIKYFSLPDNGPTGLSDQCWYKDISNVRIVGLNSNSGAADQTLQLQWLSQILTNSCSEQHIDFVFAQLHHPFKSELWTPGENDFTGKIIDSLETFTSNCGKPSIHFFGHTHAYSRGQSRDHKHLWVNVATAGGAIDNWGEFPNADYPEFVKSQDEYGFVFIEVQAGASPKFTLRRYSRGDQDTIYHNVVRDELTIYKNEYIPHQPVNIYPGDGDTIASNCLTLKASEFAGVGDSLQGAHFEIAKNSNFIDSLIGSSWSQNENFYNEVNLQAGDDLTDAIFNSIPSDNFYHWRVRYRDQNLEWSNWSTPTSFYLTNNGDTLSGNLIINEGAENGISSWTGDIEALENAECGSVNPYIGTHNFGVGGICANEQSVGIATQTIDLSLFSAEINSGIAIINVGGYIRNFNGSDLPEMFVEFYNGANLIQSTASISNNTANWTLIQSAFLIPQNSTSCNVVLKGTRNAGTDNDCYFDALHLIVMTGTCPSCFGSSNIDADNDGFCSDIDCDDLDSTIYQGAIEICDGKDNNCDGQFELGPIANWTGVGGNHLWSDAANWDQNMVPLPCQYVFVQLTDSVSVDGIFACKGIDIGDNGKLTVQPSAYLDVDSQQDPSLIPAFIKGALIILGRWEVR